MMRMSLLGLSPALLAMLAITAGGPAAPAAIPPPKPPLSAAERQALAERNLRESAAFLAANAKRPEVATFPSGLQYEVLQPGSGPPVRDGDRVTLKFEWFRADGRHVQVLDGGAPVTVYPSELMPPGFAEAVRRMPAGAKWKIYVPPALGFGAAGRGDPLGPNTVLVIECELLRLAPGKPPA